MKTTIDTVRTAEIILHEVRVDYLTEAGWAEASSGRWAKDFPWGAQSSRRVEADLIDAVEFQAKRDGQGRE